MATTPRTLTADELLRLPDDGRRHELIAGELRTMAPTGEEHAGITALFTTFLTQYVLAHRLGRVVTGEPGFLLATDPDTVRAPDVAFVNHERIEATGTVTGYRRGAPDLAVEVISPNDRYTDVEEKVATWLEHGARLVVVVNPRGRTVTVYRPPQRIRHLTVADTLEGEEVVPGWSLPLRELFSQMD